MKNKNQKSAPDAGAQRAPELKKGKYSDGRPLDDLQYLEGNPPKAHV